MRSGAVRVAEDGRTVSVPGVSATVVTDVCRWTRIASRIGSPPALLVAVTSMMKLFLGSGGANAATVMRPVSMSTVMP